MYYKKKQNNPDLVLEPRFILPSHSGQVIRAGEGDGEEPADTAQNKILENEVENQQGVTTRYGRVSKPPERLIHEMTGIGLTEAEATYFALILTASQNGFESTEIACVGAGLGGGFTKMQ